MAVTTTPSVLLLDENHYRVSYYVQNHDAANFIAISPNQTVTAGGWTTNEGLHIHAATLFGPEEHDKDQVWAVANGGTVNVTVIEVADVPSARAEPRP